MAILGPHAEGLAEAALARLDNGVERRLEAFPVLRVQIVEPIARRSLEATALEPETLLGFGRRDDLVGKHVPVPDHVAGTGERQRLALAVVHLPLRDGAAREGMLHDGEAEQQDDQHEATGQRRLGQVADKAPRHGKTGSGQPGEEHEPGRHQHDRPIVASQSQRHDQHETDAAERCQHHAGDAGGDRGIVKGKREQAGQRQKRDQHHVAIAHVPPIEIEIGVEEDHHGDGDHHLRPGAVELIGPRADGEHLVPETEVYAEVGEHRPGQRCRGREHHRSLDHEQDGQEQGEKAGDAEHDAAVERVGVDAILVGVGLPKADLRQVACSELDDEGDHGAGVERHQEDVGVLTALPLRGETRNSA